MPAAERAHGLDHRAPQSMHPDVPETKLLDNPYTYTDYRSGRTHGQ